MRLAAWSIVAEFKVLAFSEAVEGLIRTYDRPLGLVGSATADLPHFAYAVAYNMDYLVTMELRPYREWPDYSPLDRGEPTFGKAHAGDRDSRRAFDDVSWRRRMTDPIVEEIRETRWKIFAECNGDLDQLISRLKQAELKR